MNAPPETLAAWLGEEPFHLALGAGWFGFVAHGALLEELVRRDLRPASVSGVSGGAVAAACHASGMSVERMRDLMLGLRREDVWDPLLGFALVRGRRLRRLLDRELPKRTFEEAELPLEISVADLFGGGVESVRSGAIAPAVHASLAVPLVFRPVRLGGRLRMDGGFRDPYAVAGRGVSDRVLVHDVRSDSAPGRGLATARRRVLSQEGRLPLGPRSLHLAGRAWEDALLRARRLLDAPLVSSPS